jgi:hypothetical protein
MVIDVALTIHWRLRLNCLADPAQVRKCAGLIAMVRLLLSFALNYLSLEQHTMADDPKPQDNPLYGAPPPPTNGASTGPAPNTSSSEARIPEPKSTNPLFGATPPPSQLTSPVRQQKISCQLYLTYSHAYPSAHPDSHCPTLRVYHLTSAAWGIY